MRLGGWEKDRAHLLFPLVFFFYCCWCWCCGLAILGSWGSGVSFSQLGRFVTTGSANKFSVVKVPVPLCTEPKEIRYPEAEENLEFVSS
ncbi:hypothetical protein LX36DRAFT_329594 [Colletotrichum falcatum]|nr:hypothetical protein LX36DRAFT_329594 [Colletotrichum falcatum]